MTVLQTLTLAEVKAKAREYHAAGKLTAQHPNPQKRVCVNNGADGHRCAVAAAFNDELIAACPYGTFCSIVSEGSVVADDVYAIHNIQRAHDSWAGAAHKQSSNAKDLEAEFLKLIREDQ